MSESLVQPIRTPTGVGLVIVAALVVFLAACGGDRQGTPLGQPPSGGGSQSIGNQEANSQVDPSLAATKKPTCPMNREVKSPADGTPEAVVVKLYEAALNEDEEAGFETFYSLFAKQHKRSWVKSQYWPRARKHVKKYVTGRDPLTYRICREQGRTEGEVKFFIRSYDETKTDPPITLVKEGSTWKVDFFTP